MPLVKVNGYFIALKGNIEEEVKEAKNTINILNSEIEDIINFDLYHNNGQRNIIKIRKNKESTLKDLRPYDKIMKKPLQKLNK